MLQILGKLHIELEVVALEIFSCLHSEFKFLIHIEVDVVFFVLIFWDDRILLADEIEPL